MGQGLGNKAVTRERLTEIIMKIPMKKYCRKCLYLRKDVTFKRLKNWDERCDNCE